MVMYVFLILFFVFATFPVIYTLLASFKTNSEILASSSSIIPKSFMFENYIQAWNIANFSTYTWNSVYMSAIVVTASIITGTMGGYVLQRSDIPGKKIIFGVFMSTMFINLGTIGLFPLLEIAKAFGIHRTLWGVIIIRVFGINVMGIFLVSGYLKTIPKELDEAAIIDGCSFFKTYSHIILPTLKPIIATIGLLTFRSTWNDYMLPMVFTISNLNQAPLTVGIVALKSSGAVASSWNLMLAGSMISMVPLIIIYLFLNRYFISGLTTGAVKG